MAIVKSYIANTQKEAFEKVKMDLGSEAIIINTRKIRRKGFWGIFQKPVIEMTAVVDEIPQKKVVDNDYILQQNKQQIQALIHETLKNDKLETIEKQMSQVSDMVSKVYQDVDRIRHKELTQFEPPIQELFNELIENEISEANSLRIIREAKELAEEEMELKDAVIEVLRNFIGDPTPINLVDERKQVAFFVGPTGVGKTTTIAKIAAIFSLQHNVKVGIITEDTYRIGAVEQLKIYADILDLPLNVVYSPDEIRQKIDNMGDVDLILVDTAGKNTNDQEYHQTISSMINHCENAEVHLVISATTGDCVVEKILQSYSSLKDYKLLITKLDECSKWGAIVNMKCLTGKPISYLTQGQNVAEDILVANFDMITNKLLGCEVP